MLSKFKNKSKTNEAENRQKIKNSQSQFKIYWFLSNKSEYVVYILLYCWLQSRSQDFAKGGVGGGFFGSLIQPKTNLTQIFISLKLDWGGFSVKIRWSPKKKFFTEIQRFLSAEITNSRVSFRPKSETQGFFSAECRWSPTKKGLHRNSKDFFCRNQKLKGFFWPKSGDLQKIGLQRLWVSSWTKKLHYSGPNNAKSFTTSAPKSLWGGLFSFLEQKIGLKSTRNVLFCIFFRPMGKARAPPPSPLATLQVDCRQQLYTNLQYKYIFCLFVNSEQTHYFKIGKFCLFMMSRSKLNVKWQVTQTGGQSGLQLSSF